VRYYEILKARRQDLKLSIQDVSLQTRLAPEYIQAIEENNLDIFSDDFSFVRYFVQAYCQAIGVNWNAISEEVEGTIRHYAHQRNMALTQAQRRMVQSMPSAQSVTRRRPNTYQSRVTRTSRSLQKRRISKKAIGLLVFFAVVLFGFQAVMSTLSNQEETAAKLQEEADLKARQEETQRLAELRKQEAVPETTMSLEGNVLTVSAPFPYELDLTVKMAEQAVLYVYQGETLLTDLTYQTEWKYSKTIEEATTLTFETDIDTPLTIQICSETFEWNVTDNPELTLQITEAEK
jgi:cell division protein FtsB